MTEVISIGSLLSSFTDTAFRLEARSEYAVDEERDALQGYLEGSRVPPSRFPWWQDWLDMIRSLSAEGRVVGRVRVLSEPLTPYQRWECWGDRWHAAAGERIAYLPRSRAQAIGLPLEDWWLFDSRQLVLMRFDDAGALTGTELVTDPAIVRVYRGWQKLALRHASPAAGLAA